jgi:hypothetical protein
METPEVHAHHHAHTGNRWVDLALGGSAILISMVSLFVAIAHGRVMEKLVEENHRQVQASTWPYLQIEEQTTYKGNVAIAAPSLITANISNHGNGPARIKTLEVSVDGKNVASLAALLRACCLNAASAHGRFNLSGGGASDSVLAQKESATFLSLAPVNPPAQAMAKALVAAAPRIKIKSCYCSVFDECWYAEQGQPPREVKACPTHIVNFDD